MVPPVITALECTVRRRWTVFNQPNAGTATCHSRESAEPAPEPLTYVSVATSRGPHPSAPAIRSASNSMIHFFPWIPPAAPFIDRSTYMRYLLLGALLWSAPALAQRATTHGGAMTTNRADPRTSSTTDWRWMTAGIRATEALQRNVRRGDRGGAVQRDQFRDRAGPGAFGRAALDGRCVEPPTF